MDYGTFENIRKNVKINEKTLINLGTSKEKYFKNDLHKFYWNVDKTPYPSETVEISKNLVCKTKDNEILIIEAQVGGHYGKKTPSVHVRVDVISPILVSEAERRAKEYLEDGELWKMAVENDNTTLGLDDWVDYVLSVDGWESQIDTSLYDEEVEIDGEDYIFESLGFGGYREEISKEFPELKPLIKLSSKTIWRAELTDLIKARFIIKNKIKNQDVDARVKELATEIIRGD
jgi:hypothetical protein